MKPITLPKHNWNGTKWIIEADIRGCFDNIDHDVLMELLAKRIEDRRFLKLIRSFLQAGYLEDWVYHRTYSGTPQGGTVSPILANIYLHELDEWLERKACTFNQGKAALRWMPPIAAMCCSARSTHVMPQARSACCGTSASAITKSRQVWIS